MTEREKEKEIHIKRPPKLLSIKKEKKDLKKKKK